MYKLLLCWRYLRTRWIALASIVSVTLGVATMIVVNSVMAGFRHEMQERIHGILSDVVFESNSLIGFYDAQWHMEQIRQVAGDYIEGMTATVVVPALLTYQYNDRTVTRPVQLIGIDEETQSEVGDFCKYLQHPANRQQISFQLRDGGYDMRDHQAGDEAPDRPDMAQAGWAHRRRWVERQRMIESMQPRADREDAPVDPFRSDAALPAESTDPLVPVTDATPDATWPARASAAPRHAAADEPRANPSEPAAWASSPTGEEESGNPFRGLPVATPGLPADRPPREPVDQLQPDASSVHAATAAVEQAQERAPAADAAAAADLVAAGESAGAVKDPFDARPREEDVFDPASEQHDGLVLGMALASYRDQQGRDRFLALPGDDVKLSFPTAGTPPDVCHASFTIVDFYESKMSEYDASFVFVPIRTLQKLRGMFDPTTGIGYATSIQIKLRPGADGDAVRDMLRANFMPQLYNVSTWRDKQGPLLAAVQLETAILNLLLFLIIAVAGFGILAIFFMIVVEKTRDIGILKSLGASGRGILGIFLGYGLSLGLVGAGAGLAIGLLFIAYINEIADVLGLITGHEVFDPSIYYFLKIPTIVDPATVAWIVTGALAIAVLASVLPARRAARLHPVEALRYE